MLKLILTTNLFLIFFFSYSSFAQPLEFSGNSMLFNGNSVTKKEVKKILATNAHAYYLYKNASVLRSVGNTVQVIGLIGSTISLVQILTDDSSNQTKRLVFFGPIYFIGTIFKIFSKAKMREVTILYNKGQTRHLKKDNEHNFNIGLSQNGVGFVINF